MLDKSKVWFEEDEYRGGHLFGLKPKNNLKKILKIIVNSKKKLVIIKRGDHSLSSPKWLKILKKELKIIIN